MYHSGPSSDDGGEDDRITDLEAEFAAAWEEWVVRRAEGGGPVGARVEYTARVDGAEVARGVCGRAAWAWASRFWLQASMF